MDEMRDKRVLSVEALSESTMGELSAFLKRYEEYAFFMLSNMEAHGFKLSDAPYSGNFKLIRQRFKEGSSKTIICAAFCLTRSGTLLVQSDLREEVFSLILEACKEEEVVIKGVVGEWEFSSAFWNFLKAEGVITQERCAFKELLYSIDLSTVAYPKEKRVDFLVAEDYPDWKELYRAYLQESGMPNALNEMDLHRQFLTNVKARRIWGLFMRGILVSIVELNGKAGDLGNIGALFTTPDFRKQGLATHLIGQLMMDAKTIHHLRILTLFTGEENQKARGIYHSLGFQQKGYLALLFGS